MSMKNSNDTSWDFFVRYDFIQCSIAVHTRDITGNKKSLSDVLLSVVF